MLTRVNIQKFRCFKELDVPLRPLTVLIGLNDSGKSAFLAALDHYARGDGGIVTDRWRLQDVGFQIGVLEAGAAEQGFCYFHSNGTITGSKVARPRSFRVGYYQLPSTGVGMLSSGVAEGSEAALIAKVATEVPGLLDYFLRQDRKRYDEIERAACDLIPGLEEIKIASPQPGTRRVDLVIENGLTIPADNASVGVRLILFFIALAYHPNPPELILLEEPENGVHPRRLAEVMRLLRELTQGKHGSCASQIILTTHSPYLLDLVKPEEDQVLVFRRNKDGSRSADPLNKDRLKPFLDEFMLGEVWYNQEEEGLVSPK